MYAKLFGILILTALVCSVEGFHNYVWFLSIGYGLAVAGISIVMFLMGIHGTLHLSAGFVLLCLLLLAYGIRLAGFLIYREAKNAAYRKTLAEAAKDASGDHMSFLVKLMIWLSVAVLYAAETAPVLYRGTVEGNHSWILGALIALFGIVFESVADHQKSAYKKVDPHSPAMKGLYKIVRCPNYLGEIIFWTGIFVSGIPVCQGMGQWIVCLAGWITIVGVMFSSAARLEKRQNRNYGHMKQYVEYAEHTPILIPFVPLYHLVKEVRYGK